MKAATRLRLRAKAPLPASFNPFQMNAGQTKGLILRDLLQEELLRRCRTNPGYSLRAFARFLKISPSSLSRILRGERHPSAETCRRLGLSLNLSLEQINSLSPAPLSPQPAGYYKQVSFDTFAAMSDWYHFALIELTHLQDFQSEPRWAARALGITVSEVRAAYERLERLGFLRRTGGDWVNASGDHSFIFDSETRASALRNLQRQFLEKAGVALDMVEPELRNQTGMTMAIDSRRLPEAIRRIATFRRDLCAYLEAGEIRDEVYQLSLSLFPITKPNRKKVPSHENVQSS